MPLSVWKNFTLAPTANPDELITDACLVIENDQIVWLGTAKDLPDYYQNIEQNHDLGGRFVTPGLVDCHTHLVFGSNRAREFAMRLAGADYAEIAQQGGGIVSTVKATRTLSEDDLYQQSLRRLDALIAEGVTAIEIKSGYGLDLESEAKTLRVARRLSVNRPITVSTTFLGAHALPPEYAGRADDYIDLVCETMLPALAAEGLVDAVDVFCEHIAFDLAQTERVFKAAKTLGLPVKIHAEQLSNMGGTALAGRYQALSSDHLEYLDEAGVQALKASGTVAVLLPGAFYFLREKQLPPIDLLRQYQVPMAISTDSNPGTSPCTSLLLMLNMASTLFRLSVPEVLAGVTQHAAQAMGHPEVTGVLAINHKADFVAWDVQDLSELVYWMGLPRCALVVRHGKVSVDNRKDV